MAIRHHGRPEQPQAQPVTILLVAPYTSRGGGMGRLMAYLAAVDTAPSIRFEAIESRGEGSALSSCVPFLKAAWYIGWSARRPGKVILHVNMAERGSVVRKGALLLLGRSLGLSTVLHLHAAEMVPFYKGLSVPSKKIVQFIFQSAGVCIVLGHGCGQWLNAVLGVPQDRIEVLANGVPAPAKRPSPGADSNFNLLFLGNLQARKGLGDLLSALSQEPLAGRDWELIVAGGGNAAPFQRQARQLGLAERVRFTGWLDRDACSGLLARAGLLILPSYHEGLPLVLLEAASLGIPSVTSPVGAIPEVFVDQETASFVAPGDVRTLSKAILQMIDDPGLRGRIGKNARSLYETSLSIETFSKGLSAIYARHCFGISRNAPCGAIRAG